MAEQETEVTIELDREVVANADALKIKTWMPPRRALDEVLNCSQRVMGTAAWWSCLAQRLDSLRDEMAACDIDGLAAQIIADAPHYATAARRLPLMDNGVQTRARELRIRIAELAGSRTAAPQVAAEVSDLLRSVTALYRTSDRLLVEAYERDLGGE
jgi:hypothetical protein